MAGLCLSQHRPGQHRPGQHRPAKMATAVNEASETQMNFEILDSVVIDSGTNFFEKLTQEEREEICKVVEQLDDVNAREIIDFTDSQEELPNPRHKIVSNEELDRLAANNSSENTLYQTKWATTVIKGQ